MKHLNLVCVCDLKNIQIQNCIINSKLNIYFQTKERTKLVNESFPNTMTTLIKLWNKNGLNKKYFVGESVR